MRGFQVFGAVNLTGWADAENTEEIFSKVLEDSPPLQI
jgi:hypothetical protein